MVGTVEVEWAAPVLTVTLARPDRGNTVDGAFIADLHAALDEAEERPDCRLVVLRARGSVFSAGMDVVEAAREDASGGDPADRGAAFFELLHRFTTVPRLILCCVDGRVSGGGVGLVAACDLVHSTERGVFSLPEAMWGLLPFSVLPFLVRRVGFQPAYAMTLTTLPVTAAEAVRSRLVDELSADPAVLVRKVTARLAKVDGTVVGDAKRYFAALHPITEEAKRHAVAEFDRLAGAPRTRERFARFAATGRYPWE
ncbi:enoyl-CoA hydratase-related protein [Saccharothrix stipae]